MKRLLLLLGVAACDSKKVVAARVDGVEISDADLTRDVDALVETEGAQDLLGTLLTEDGEATPALDATWLGFKVQDQLVAAEFERAEAKLGPQADGQAAFEQFFGDPAYAGALPDGVSLQRS